jgi:hypothetical protein
MHAADGHLLAVVDDINIAVQLARQNNLVLVSVH